MDLVLLEETIDEPSGTLLLDGFEAEIASLYPGWHRDIGPSAGAMELAAPAGGFVVAYMSGQPSGCGGFKQIDARCAELKRMYVRPQTRGLGVGRKLLARIEELAARAGYERIRLDTGTSQREAQGLYRSHGYLEIPDYNGNPLATLWFEKRL
ncbi:MAG: GNAT family N-acetyltransferase [Solirubrobacteraceae bacterium]